MDEIHQWKNGFELYDMMYKGMDNRKQPLCLITSTAGTRRNDLYDIIYDEASDIINDYDKPIKDRHFIDEQSIFFIYELDYRDEWKNLDNLIKANPGLGTIRNPDSLEAEWKRAMINPNRYLKSFLTKNCNIPETSSEVFLSAAEIENPIKFNIHEMKPDYIIAGVDMASTTDLTCVSFLFAQNDASKLYVEQMYFIPEDLAKEKIEVDKVPYDLWEKQGWVTFIPGNKIDQEAVWDWVNNFTDSIGDGAIVSYAGFDKWGAELLMKKWGQRFGNRTIEEVRQGFITRSNPLKALKADLAKKRIIFNNNPILKWCMANTAVKIDKNLNIDPDKTRNQTRRIDGLISLLNAYITFLRHEEDYINLIR